MMVFSDLCERVIQTPRGGATHWLRTTALTHTYFSPHLTHARPQNLGAEHQALPSFPSVCKASSSMLPCSARDGSQNFARDGQAW